jgi:hypothetical protein
MLIYFTEKIKLYFILVYECPGCIQRGVIVKLLGRKIDYKSIVLEIILKQMWVRKGVIFMVDIRNY